jgi:O-antigen/teichoic acid export membrane protein
MNAPVANTHAAAPPRRERLNPALLVFAANMLRAAAAFAVGLLVARLLGPAEFGLFTTFTAVTIWAHNLVGEGFDAGVVRLYARAHRDSPVQAAAVLASALTMRTLLIGPMLVLFFGAAAWWLPADIGGVVRAGAITACVASLSTLSMSVLQARENFTAYALLTPLGNLMRLLALPLLWALAWLTLWPLIWTQTLGFALTATLGLLLLRDDLRRARVDWPMLRTLFAFGKWSALATLCFVLLAYLAVPVLAKVHGAAQAGHYAAAATLLMVVDQFTVALLTAKLPATSRIDNLDGLRAYARGLAPRLLALGGGLLLLVPLSDWLVQTVYGPSYASSAAVMRALLPGFIATLLSHPLYLVLYALDRPQGYAASGVAALLAWCGLAAWWVPAHAELGAAWATTGARVLQALLILGLVHAALRRRATKPPLSKPEHVPS